MRNVVCHLSHDNGQMLPESFQGQPRRMLYIAAISCGRIDDDNGAYLYRKPLNIFVFCI